MRLETKRHSSKSGLFLMELMIAILFFSLASGICIQLFAKAYLISKTSSELNMATLQAQSAAESLRGANGSGERMAELLGEGAVLEGEQLLVCYDEAWQPCAPQEAAYRMTVALAPADSPLMRAEISVERPDGAEIFALSTAHLVDPKRIGG